MTQTTWEKVQGVTEAPARRAGVQWKFIISGLVLLVAVVLLIITQTTSGAQYFMTVSEVANNSKYVGQTIRISGAVVGDTIKYDSKTLTIDFSIANIPKEGDNQADILFKAANDPAAQRLAIHIENQVKPDLLKHEAQAILTGKMGSDGVFQATELLLKCPSRFGESDPNAIVMTPGTK
jgi:cytochrome c-type biogenesis protein CcmE